jgi:hypothetical protein
MTDARNSTTEGQAATLATQLQQASPDRAHAFALGMHERACRDGDESRIELWLAILANLKATAPVGNQVNVPQPNHPRGQGLVSYRNESAT